MDMVRGSQVQPKPLLGRSHQSPGESKQMGLPPIFKHLVCLNDSQAGRVRNFAREVADLRRLHQVAGAW